MNILCIIQPKIPKSIRFRLRFCSALSKSRYSIFSGPFQKTKLNIDIIKSIEDAQLKAQVDEFHVGDTVKVYASGLRSFVLKIDCFLRHSSIFA